MSLDPMPTWFIDEKLREHGHTDEFRKEVVCRMESHASLRRQIEFLNRRVAYLEQHVPDEIRNPTPPVAASPGVRFTGD